MVPDGTEDLVAVFRSRAHLRTVRCAVFRNIKMNEPGILLEKRQQKR